MKKRFLIIVFILGSSLFTFSVAQQKKEGGGATNADFGNSIVQTADGGYALTGSTNSYSAGKDNVYVLKLDSVGKLQWTKTISSKNINYAYSIIQTTDGGYAIAGYSDSVHGGGNADVYVVKLDAKGTVEWAKTIGEESWDIAYSIFQTKDGGYAITGSSFSFSAGSNTVYVVRLDASGKILWTKNIGEKSNAIGCSIIQTNDGGYAITGVTYLLGAGGGDVYVIKLDAAGNIEWTKTIGGTEKDMGFSIIQTADYGYAITGVTYSYGAGNGDVYVIKLDTKGNVKWTKAIGGPGTDQGASIVQTKDLGYVITGSTSSPGSVYNFDIYVVRVDSIGNLKWTKTIGGPGNDEGSSIAQTKNGGYAITGFSQSYSADCYNAFLLKLDTTGSVFFPAHAEGKATPINKEDKNIDSSKIAGNTFKNNTVSTNICSVLPGTDDVNTSANEIQIYPNPCTTKLYLNFGSSNLSKDIISVQITDITNRVLLNLVLTPDIRPVANNYSLDVSSFNPGIYFLHTSCGGKTDMKKFTKE